MFVVGGGIENTDMSSMVSRIKRLLWSRVVLKTDQDYRFIYADDGAVTCRESAANDPAPLLLLVGRAHCYELRTPIPNVDPAEAAKIADNMPVSSPFGESIRRNRLLVSSDGNIAHITLVRRLSLTTDWLMRPLLIMPATWLVDRLIDEKPSVVALPGEIVGIAPSKSGYQSRLLDGSEGAEGDFWWSSGNSPDSVQRFDEGDVISSLGTVIAGLSWRDWAEAFWKPEVSPLERFKSLDWKSASLTLATGLAIYLLITSTLLMSVSWILDRQLANEPQAFSDVLALRAERNQLLAKDRAWTEAVREQYPTWALWPPILELWDENTFVIGVQVSNGKAEVMLTADRGTDALMSFKQSAYVKDADFGDPIQRNLRLERDTFSIEWELTDRQSPRGSSDEATQ